VQNRQPSLLPIDELRHERNGLAPRPWIIWFVAPHYFQYRFPLKKRRGRIAAPNGMPFISISEFYMVLYGVIWPYSYNGI
jgi:hypothetical protein